MAPQQRQQLLTWLVILERTLCLGWDLQADQRERGGGRAKTPLAISTAFIKQDTADVVPPSINYSPSPGVAVTITQHLQRGDLRMELLSLLERADGTFFALHCL